MKAKSSDVRFDREHARALVKVGEGRKKYQRLLPQSNFRGVGSAFCLSVELRNALNKKISGLEEQ